MDFIYLELCCCQDERMKQQHELRKGTGKSVCLFPPDLGPSELREGKRSLSCQQWGGQTDDRTPYPNRSKHNVYQASSFNHEGTANWNLAQIWIQT